MKWRINTVGFSVDTRRRAVSLRLVSATLYRRLNRHCSWYTAHAAALGRVVARLQVGGVIQDGDVGRFDTAWQRRRGVVDHQRRRYQRLWRRYAVHKLLPVSAARLVESRQDSTGDALPRQSVRRQVHADDWELPPQDLQHPRRVVSAWPARHVRQQPVSRHETTFSHDWSVAAACNAALCY